MVYCSEVSLGLSDFVRPLLFENVLFLTIFLCRALEKEPYYMSFDLECLEYSISDDVKFILKLFII